MKKAFVKVLMLVLATALVFTLFACDKTTTSPSTSKSPSPSPSVDPVELALDRFNEVIDLLETSFGGFDSIGNKFEIDTAAYANYEDDEYVLTAKATIDVADKSSNEDNQIAVELNKNDVLLLGLYYDGAQDVIMFESSAFSVGELDIPASKRYIDGFDLASAVGNTPEAAGADLDIGAIIQFVIGSMLTGSEITTSDGITTYSFTYELAGLISTAQMLLPGIIGDYIDVNAVLESIFENADGIDFATMHGWNLLGTIDFAFDADDTFVSADISIDIPEGTFYLNATDTVGLHISPFSLDLGISKFVVEAVSTFTVDPEVPAFDDSYEYFSPFNIDVSGDVTVTTDKDGVGTEFEAVSDTYTFALLTDINPFKFAEATGSFTLVKNGTEEMLNIYFTDETFYIWGSLIKDDEGPMYLSANIDDAKDYIDDLLEAIDSDDDTASAEEEAKDYTDLVLDIVDLVKTVIGAVDKTDKSLLITNDMLASLEAIVSELTEKEFDTELESISIDIDVNEEEVEGDGFVVIVTGDEGDTTAVALSNFELTIGKKVVGGVEDFRPEGIEFENVFVVYPVETMTSNANFMKTMDSLSGLLDAVSDLLG